MRISIAFIFLIPHWSWSQVGGINGYQTLETTTNARAAALAGTSISLADGDISQFFENPAVLDSTKAGSIFFNVNPYFADINLFTGAFAFELSRWGIFSVGIHYLSSDDMEATDPSGNVVGSFQVQDYVVVVGKAHQLGPITLGINLKLMHSSIEDFGSTAIAGDIGGHFRITKNWTVGMVFAHIGGRITNYNELVRSELPFDVKIGTTFKPEYMPIRFTITSSNLVNRNVIEPFSSESIANNQLERIFRRVNLGAELILSENFQLLIGYNHKRKQEMKLEASGGAGVSYGVMAGIKRFQIRFSRSIYHTGRGTSFISVQTNLNEVRRIL